MKKIIFFLSFIFMLSIAFADDTDYFEYADIPGTDVISFNGQFDGKIYEVKIDTGEVFYITGSDNNLHNCFKIVGTGFTEKLGEIYFQYEGNGAFICDDYKLRGVFKIGAGGRGYMEDLENHPEKWQLHINKSPKDGSFYHSKYGNGDTTGQARIDGIGFSNWNTVRTEADLLQYFQKIKVSTHIDGTNVLANGEHTADIKINLTYNGKNLKNFKVDSIVFLTGNNSDIYENGKKISPFKYQGSLKSDDNGNIIGTITSLNGGKDLEYKIKLKKGDIFFIGNGKTSSFKLPFDINLTLQGNNINHKLLIGYTNKAKLNIEKKSSYISNIKFKNVSSNISFGMYNSYFDIITGNNINIDNLFHNLKVRYTNFYSNDFINFSYHIIGDYSFIKNGKKYLIKNLKTKSTRGALYKDGKVNQIVLQKITDTDTVADGKAEQKYKIIFKDKDGFKINNLDFNFSTKDENKNFDLKLDNTYQTGYFINTDFLKNDGDYFIYISSYKPVKNSSLKLIFNNLKYSEHYTVNNGNPSKNIENISFNNLVDSKFENKILKINQENNIKYDYHNNIASDIKNPKFIFTGYATNCTDCRFIKGKTLKGNNFDNYNFDILIKSDESPQSVIYSGYYEYKLNGNKGWKLVQVPQKKKYSPVLFIESGKIIVVGNILTNKTLIGGIKYISTNISPQKILNRLKRAYYEKFIRGGNVIKTISDLDINLQAITEKNVIYKCENNNILTIQGPYEHNINFYTLGCRINIENDIYGNKGQLKIIALSDNETPNLYKNNGWNIPGNIFIKGTVKTIQASLITEGSIFTYKDNISKDNIFLDDRKNNFKTQLYIRGQVFSKNTIGGGNRYSDGTYTMVGGKKIKEGESPSIGLFADKSLKSIARAYDLSFLKSSFVKKDGTYDTGDISELIYNKYHCTGNKDHDNKFCTANIIIEYRR